MCVLKVGETQGSTRNGVIVSTLEKGKRFGKESGEIRVLSVLVRTGPGFGSFR